MLRPRSSIIQSDAEGFTRPAEFATIEHVKSVPPLLNVPRSVQTPYENKPANRILPRKRYVIMPPKPGQKSHIFPGVHHLKQLKQSTSTAYQKRIVSFLLVVLIKAIGIQEINVPRQIEQSVDMDLGIRIARPFPNTRYVLRIPKKEIPDESNKTSLNFIFRIVKLLIWFLCPEVNCFWRGATQTALRRHMAGLSYCLYSVTVLISRNFRWEAFKNKTWIRTVNILYYTWHRIGLVAQQYEMGTLQLDVNNMRPIRDLLGSSGRFRLMTDAGLCEHLPKWILQVFLELVTVLIPAQFHKIQLTGRTDVLSGDEDLKGRDNYMTYHHQRKGDNRFEVETFDLLSDDMILNYDYESDDSGSVNVDVQG
uniref:Bestrophin homolog n=1 Tax=Heterorhabditis bacteriophora TaxID=37862 RepID=A0A1I7WY62_HETBA